MNPCLNERVLLQIYLHENLAAERAHLRLCADCAERYEQLVEDLETIGRVLAAPPPASQIDRVVWWRPYRWIPAAAACMALAVLVLGVSWLRQPSPLQVAAQTSTVSAFAADLSAALFATSDANVIPQFAEEAPYLEAALEAGQPCTRERFFAGECNDQLSAFLVEND